MKSGRGRRGVGEEREEEGQEEEGERVGGGGGESGIDSIISPKGNRKMLKEM